MSRTYEAVTLYRGLASAVPTMYGTPIFLSSVPGWRRRWLIIVAPDVLHPESRIVRARTQFGVLWRYESEKRKRLWMRLCCELVDTPR